MKGSQKENYYNGSHNITTAMSKNSHHVDSSGKNHPDHYYDYNNTSTAGIYHDYNNYTTAERKTQQSWDDHYNHGLDHHQPETGSSSTNMSCHGRAGPKLITVADHSNSGGTTTHKMGEKGGKGSKGKGKNSSYQDHSLGERSHHDSRAKNGKKNSFTTLGRIRHGQENSGNNNFNTVTQCHNHDDDVHKIDFSTGNITSTSNQQHGNILAAVNVDRSSYDNSNRGCYSANMDSDHGVPGYKHDENYTARNYDTAFTDNITSANTVNTVRPLASQEHEFQQHCQKQQHKQQGKRKKQQQREYNTLNNNNKNKDLNKNFESNNNSTWNTNSYSCLTKSMGICDDGNATTTIRKNSPPTGNSDIQDMRVGNLNKFLERESGGGKSSTTTGGGFAGNGNATPSDCSNSKSASSITMKTASPTGGTGGENSNSAVKRCSYSISYGTKGGNNAMVHNCDGNRCDNDIVMKGDIPATPLEQYNHDYNKNSTTQKTPVQYTSNMHNNNPRAEIMTQQSYYNNDHTVMQNTDSYTNSYGEQQQQHLQQFKLQRPPAFGTPLFTPPAASGKLLIDSCRTTPLDGTFDTSSTTAARAAASSSTTAVALQTTRANMQKVGAKTSCSEKISQNPGVPPSWKKTAGVQSSSPSNSASLASSSLANSIAKSAPIAKPSQSGDAGGDTLNYNCASTKSVQAAGGESILTPVAASNNASSDAVLLSSNNLPANLSNSRPTGSSSYINSENLGTTSRGSSSARGSPSGGGIQQQHGENVNQKKLKMIEVVIQNIETQIKQKDTVINEKDFEIQAKNELILKLKMELARKDVNEPVVGEKKGRDSSTEKKSTGTSSTGLTTTAQGGEKLQLEKKENNKCSSKAGSGHDHAINDEKHKQLHNLIRTQENQIVNAQKLIRELLYWLKNGVEKGGYEKSIPESLKKVLSVLPAESPNSKKFEPLDSEKKQVKKEDHVDVDTVVKQGETTKSTGIVDGLQIHGQTSADQASIKDMNDQHQSNSQELFNSAKEKTSAKSFVQDIGNANDGNASGLETAAGSPQTVGSSPQSSSSEHDIAGINNNSSVVPKKNNIETVVNNIPAGEVLLQQKSCTVQKIVPSDVVTVLPVVTPKKTTTTQGTQTTISEEVPQEQKKIQHKESCPPQQTDKTDKHNAEQQDKKTKNPLLKPMTISEKRELQYLRDHVDYLEEKIHAMAHGILVLKGERTGKGPYSNNVAYMAAVFKENFMDIISKVSRDNPESDDDESSEYTSNEYGTSNYEQQSEYGNSSSHTISETESYKNTCGGGYKNTGVNNTNSRTSVIMEHHEHQEHHQEESTSSTTKQEIKSSSSSSLISNQKSKETAATSGQQQQQQEIGSKNYAVNKAESSSSSSSSAYNNVVHTENSQLHSSSSSLKTTSNLKNLQKGEDLQNGLLSNDVTVLSNCDGIETNVNINNSKNHAKESTNKNDLMIQVTSGIATTSKDSTAEFNVNNAECNDTGKDSVAAVVVNTNAAAATDITIQTAETTLKSDDLNQNNPGPNYGSNKVVATDNSAITRATSATTPPTPGRCSPVAEDELVKREISIQQVVSAPAKLIGAMKNNSNSNTNSSSNSESRLSKTNSSDNHTGSSRILNSNRSVLSEIVLGRSARKMTYYSENSEGVSGITEGHAGGTLLLDRQTSQSGTNCINDENSHDQQLDSSNNNGNRSVINNNNAMTVFKLNNSLPVDCLHQPDGGRVRNSIHTKRKSLAASQKSRMTGQQTPTRKASNQCSTFESSFNFSNTPAEQRPTTRGCAAPSSSSENLTTVKGCSPRSSKFVVPPSVPSLPDTALKKSKSAASSSVQLRGDNDDSDDKTLAEGAVISAAPAGGIVKIPHCQSDISDLKSKGKQCCQDQQEQQQQQQQQTASVFGPNQKSTEKSSMGYTTKGTSVASVPTDFGCATEINRLESLECMLQQHSSCTSNHEETESFVSVIQVEETTSVTTESHDANSGSGVVAEQLAGNSDHVNDIKNTVLRKLSANTSSKSNAKSSTAKSTTVKTTKTATTRKTSTQCIEKKSSSSASSSNTLYSEKIAQVIKKHRDVFEKCNTKNNDEETTYSNVDNNVNSATASNVTAFHDAEAAAAAAVPSGSLLNGNEKNNTDNTVLNVDTSDGNPVFPSMSTEKSLEDSMLGNFSNGSRSTSSLNSNNSNNTIEVNQSCGSNHMIKLKKVGLDRKISTTLSEEEIVKCFEKPAMIIPKAITVAGIVEEISKISKCSESKLSGGGGCSSGENDKDDKRDHKHTMIVEKYYTQ